MRRSAAVYPTAGRGARRSVRPPARAGPVQRDVSGNRDGYRLAAGRAGVAHDRVSRARGRARVSSQLSEPAPILLARKVAERGFAGDILATEIVRMLTPRLGQGRWSGELATSIGEPAQLLHRIDWPRSGEERPITVVVAEDVALIRAGLVSLLREDGLTVVGEAGDFDSALASVRSSRPRLLITDVRMPPGQGDEGLRAAALLRSEQPGLAVLVLSQFVQASAAADLLTAQTSGLGYLLKERVTALDEFLDAARTVAAGGTVIDPLITAELLSRRSSGGQLDTLAGRERSVLELMAQGLSNTAIADQLTSRPARWSRTFGQS